MEYGWNLNQDIWKEIPQELLRSKEWGFVRYDRKAAFKVPKGKPGIYIFCTSPPGIKRPMKEIERNVLFPLLYTPIYVGETEDLQRRFIDHWDYDDKKHPKIDKARECFGISMQFWFHVRDVEQIKIDESILIECFGPVANNKYGVRRKKPINASVGEAMPIGVHDKPDRR